MKYNKTVLRESTPNELERRCKPMIMTNTKPYQLNRYWPLIALVLVALAAATALMHGGDKSFHGWMHYFMGMFFCQFAMLKLFNPQAFADGFQKYDLLGKRYRGYAYAYPLIELALGLLYLSFICPLTTYAITAMLMGFSAIGVIRALKAGLDVRCACMGTVLDVPLSTVTLTEDLVMGVMAVLMLASTVSHFS